MQKNVKILPLKKNGFTLDLSGTSDVTVRVLSFSGYHRDKIKYYFLSQLVSGDDAGRVISIFYDGDEELKVNDILNCTIVDLFNSKRGFHYQLTEVHKIDRFELKLI